MRAVQQLGRSTGSVAKGLQIHFHILAIHCNRVRQADVKSTSPTLSLPQGAFNRFNTRSIHLGRWRRIICKICKTFRSTCQAFRRQTSSSVARQPRFAFVHISNRAVQTVALLSSPSLYNAAINASIVTVLSKDRLRRMSTAHVMPAWLYIRVQEWQYVTLLVPSTHHCTRLLFLQIPKQVSRFWKLLFHRGYFFKTKSLGKLRLKKELPPLRRQQLPVATVKLPQFWWFSRKFITYFNSSITSSLPRRLSKPSSTPRKRSKNVKRTKNTCLFDWQLCPKCCDPLYIRRFGANGRRAGPKKWAAEAAACLKKDSQTHNAKIKYKKKSQNSRKADEEHSEYSSCIYCLGTSREMWIQRTDSKLRSREERTDGSPKSVCLKLPVWWKWNALFRMKTCIAVGVLVLLVC